MVLRAAYPNGSEFTGNSHEFEILEVLCVSFGGLSEQIHFQDADVFKNFKQDSPHQVDRDCSKLPQEVCLVVPKQKVCGYI